MESTTNPTLMQEQAARLDELMAAWAEFEREYFCPTCHHGIYTDGCRCRNAEFGCPCGSARGSR